MGHVAEHRLVPKLVSYASAETLNESVLHRLAGGDVVPFDAAFGGKG